MMNTVFVNILPCAVKMQNKLSFVNLRGKFKRHKHKGIFSSFLTALEKLNRNITNKISLYTF